MEREYISNQSQKYIYVAFLSTSTGTGRLIRFVTRNKYNHVVVSFDKNLSKMYSFARYYENVPLFGGFIEESALRYSLSGEGAVPVKICAIPVTGQKYNDALRYIGKIKENSCQYIYNSYSAAMALFHKKVRIGQAYTCLEFAGSVLSDCGIADGIDPARFYSIADLETILKDFVVYEGNLKELGCTGDWGNDLFYLKSSKRKAWTSTVKHFYRLTRRLIG